MEAKKSIKILAFLTVGAIAIFFLVLFLNTDIESRKGAETSTDLLGLEQNGQQQSFAAANMPVKSESDFVVGPGGEELDVIVYEDYADIYSAQFAETLERARAEFGEKINFVYRPYNVLSSELSAQAAQAVLCAAENNSKGADYRSKVFTALRAEQLNGDVFSRIAEEVGIEKGAFAACLTNMEKKEKIEGLVAGAANFSVTGAPTVFVGDEMIVGARPYEAFTDSNGDEIEGLKQVIERQLK
ncbi:hypothetical protein CVU83_00250 [Candidatus Falkowbacteria bacterium HGW-Falkowbacteria-2]|uniref:DSBA-like thioredoxin domain-containing protein n=1 Tax=Candidatus Falkowbacteria bacterium HGW-Falkowbacteria-2 TaxID=2013769 RepID=A0A2N2E3U3_9BACT|nr:MAG: hypothetical protein CVU83_00250 [Candidatus Falkowbacteria bacterium HGW-Falkowbacteria-2]